MWFFFLRSWRSFLVNFDLNPFSTVCGEGGLTDIAWSIGWEFKFSNASSKMGWVCHIKL
jgi:hypothetical protein